MSKGFDPDRFTASKRDQPVIPQILSADTERLAKGFTEIKVAGLGGAGGNTLDRMIATHIHGIDFVAINTDVQALEQCQARKRVPIGGRLTGGLGVGGDVKLGGRAAEASRVELTEALAGADMIFVTGGLGGGTGTGAAPVVAAVAKETGALTVGVVTLPFSFEGARRREAALWGVEQLRPLLDAMIVISNDRLLQLAPPNTGIKQSFQLADDTLNHGIHGIADLILTPGLINLDYADVRSVMYRAGPAMMGTGLASGEDRARAAAEAAISSPLLDTRIDGAHSVLINITGGTDLSLFEVNEAAMLIGEHLGQDCNIIFGAVVHPHLEGQVRITVIATGFSKD